MSQGIPLHQINIKIYIKRRVYCLGRAIGGCGFESRSHPSSELITANLDSQDAQFGECM